MMNKLSVIFLFCFLAFATLTGCNEAVMTAVKSISNLTKGKVWLEKVQFRVDDDMNDSAPVSIHLLVIYKQEVYDELAGTTAEDYFKKTDQLRRDNPNMIDFFTWDVVPGQAKEEQNVVASRSDGVGILIFARYKSPGDHRIAVGEDRQIRLILEKLDFRSDKIQ